MAEEEPMTFARMLIEREGDEKPAGYARLAASSSRHCLMVETIDRIMMMGSETELGFRFGGVFDRSKEITAGAISRIEELLFPFFLKYVGEKNKGFTRNPADPWLRRHLHQFSREHIKELGEAAASNDPSVLKSAESNAVRDLINKTNIAPADLYLGEIGVFLPNSCRLYIDGGHLEYSSAECRDPRDIVCLEKAMERMIEEARVEIEQVVGRRLEFYKDNTDHKGNSYACHENFLLKRPFFYELHKEGFWSRAWASFLETSLIYTGAGKVLWEGGNSPCGYQISQRADHFQRLFGHDTMQYRPIINFRGEPLVPDDEEENWARFHVILSDSNMAEWPLYLKMGTKALVLYMLQSHFERNFRGARYASTFLVDPVKAVKAISRDLTCGLPLELIDSKGGMSPLDIQKIWHECAEDFYRRDGSYYYMPWIRNVMEKWGQVLDWLQNDDESLDRVLDWRIKRNIIQNFREKRARRGQDISWSDDRVANIDVSYHGIGPDGLYNRLLASGEIERIVRDEDVAWARTHSPSDTRAFARGQFIKNWLPHLLDVSWELVVLRLKIGNFEKIAKADLHALGGSGLNVSNLIAGHTNFEAFCADYLDKLIDKKLPL